MRLSPNDPLVARATSAAVKPAARLVTAGWVGQKPDYVAPGYTVDELAAPVTLWLPLPPSWNRVFKARAMPIGKGKYTAQVYKSSEGKQYEAAIAAHAKVEGLTPWPRTTMLRFSGVVAMERAGCDMDDRLKVFFDALKGVLFEDDEQVAEYAQVRRIVDSKRPGITATFEPISVDRYGDPLEAELFTNVAPTEE